MFTAFTDNVPMNLVQLHVILVPSLLNQNFAFQLSVNRESAISGLKQFLIDCHFIATCIIPMEMPELSNQLWNHSIAARRLRMKWIQQDSN